MTQMATKKQKGRRGGIKAMNRKISKNILVARESFVFFFIQLHAATHLSLMLHGQGFSIWGK